MYKCIYCLNDKTEIDFQKAEHIIPQGFGRFKDNLTLHLKVCDDCNQYFGDNIELNLSRDTFEGIYRYVCGIKDPDDYKGLGKRSTIEIKITSGHCKNMYAYIKKGENYLKYELLEQIGILRKDTHEYEYFLFNNFPSKSEIKLDLYDLKNERAFNIISHDYNKANKLLSKLGLKCRIVEIYGKKNINKFDADITSTIDSTIIRCLAKISFNYFVYFNDTEILLHKGFDSIRNFIRWGDLPEIVPFKVENKPILMNEPTTGWRIECHIITLQLDNNLLFTQLALFNNLTYKVLLSDKIIPSLKIVHGRGHLFNCKDKSIIKLSSKPI